MYAIGDTVMYKSEGPCTIVEICEKDFSGSLAKYYLLRPVFKPSANLYIPLDNEILTSKMKPIITKEEAEKTISDFKSENPGWVDNATDRKKMYKDAFESSNRLDLLRAIRMVRTYRDSSDKSSKKPHVFDLQFIRDAERCMEEELNIVLGMQRDEFQALLDCFTVSY